MTTTDHSPGKRFRDAVANENPLQVVGTVNALCARMAHRSGYRAIYLSGAGVANASLGLPDLGMTTLDDVLVDAGRIAQATPLPVLVDCDTGWETTAGIAQTVIQMHQAGVAAIHLEDQTEPKRCGHRPGKRLVTTEQMVDRIKRAVDARIDPQMVIMARTDAAADEGVNGAIDRAAAYVDAGADMIFAEAFTSEDQFRQFTQQVHVPVLANMTEFGRSPLLSVDQLRSLGIQLVLYPLTAFRAMNQSAMDVYRVLRKDGTQREILDRLQTRDELYDLLDYHQFEQWIDQGIDPAMLRAKHRRSDQSHK